MQGETAAADVAAAAGDIIRGQAIPGRGKARGGEGRSREVENWMAGASEFAKTEKKNKTLLQQLSTIKVLLEKKNVIYGLRYDAMQ